MPLCTPGADARLYRVSVTALVQSEPTAAPPSQSRAILRDLFIVAAVGVAILAVLAGAELSGSAGIFIAIPLVALVTVVARHWLEWHGRDAESLAPTLLPAASEVHLGR